MTISPTATNAPEAFGSSFPHGVERDNLERTRQYLAAIEGSAANGGPFTFLAPDIRQVEYPNQFVPKGAERDFAAMADAAERGRRVTQFWRLSHVPRWPDHSPTQLRLLSTLLAV